MLNPPAGVPRLSFSIRNRRLQLGVFDVYFRSVRANKSSERPSYAKTLFIDRPRAYSSSGGILTPSPFASPSATAVAILCPFLLAVLLDSPISSSTLWNWKVHHLHRPRPIFTRLIAIIADSKRYWTGSNWMWMKWNYAPNEWTTMYFTVRNTETQDLLLFQSAHLTSFILSCSGLDLIYYCFL